MQQSKTFTNSIDQIIDSAKNQSSFQSLSINIPSPIITGGIGRRNDALVYTVIEIVSYGTDSTGNNITRPPVGAARSKVTCLPPPIDIIDMHSANWEGVSVGLQRAALDKYRGFTSFGGIQTALGTIGQGIKALENEEHISQYFTKAVSDNLYNLETLAGRISMNPNIEMAFRSANLRQMQLQFRLVPLNRSDSVSIKEFIDAMKVLMYATNTFGTETSAGFIGYPATFIIKVRSVNEILFSMGNNDFLVDGESRGKAGCVLTDLQVSFGEAGMYAGHFDGSPGFINLNLTFQETIQSTRDSIIKEYGI